MTRPRSHVVHMLQHWPNVFTDPTTLAVFADHDRAQRIADRLNRFEHATDDPDHLSCDYFVRREVIR